MITYETMLRRYRAIDQKAKEIARVRQTAALRAAELAGVGGCLGTAGHNAMIAYRAGKPWPEIDYPMLRRAFWLMDRSFAPARIAEKAWSRLYSDWQSGGCKYDPRA